MNPTESKRIQQAFKELIDYDELMNCTRCGFCLPSCPTYAHTNDEVHSPRGRIALMKGVIDGFSEPDDNLKRALDMCLGCRGCEPACPSGVQFGKLLEQSREAIYQNKKESIFVRQTKKFIFRRLFPNKLRLIHATSLIGLYQRTSIRKIAYKTKAIRLLPSSLREMEKALPVMPTKKEMLKRPTHVKTKEKPKARVAFFSGCLMDTVFMKTNDATLKLLQYAGCEVTIPQNQNCCGALHGHSGQMQQAKELAKQNIIAFEKLNVDYIITNAGGCGAYLYDYMHLFKDDYEWKERAAKFSSQIKDVTSILYELKFHQGHLALPPQMITYQDSCHLRNGQQTYEEPRKLLQAIEGVQYVEMPQANSCCGSAGIYNIIEHDMSMKILEAKMENVKRTGAKTVVTSNPGCLLQMNMGIKREGLENELRTVHIVDLLIEAYEYAHRRKKAIDSQT
ncbi:MAG: (Fe-S)-binding protein [Bacilli bacterium]|nr:(Fe-S)-binding protein [Bacilli bacterium]